MAEPDATSPAMPVPPQRRLSCGRLAREVEEPIRTGGNAEIPSHEMGLAVLGPLRDLDEVAYLRFAFVYRSFSSVEDFEKEIADLRTAQRTDDRAEAKTGPRTQARKGTP